MQLGFGERIDGLVVGGKTLRAAVFNEREVRAGAGTLLVMGAVAFSFAYFEQEYILLQIVSTFMFIEFLLRLTVGVRYAPIGALARLMVRSQTPEWVSAKPKRFAWELALAMSFSMTIITNSGIRGWLPRSMCLICMTLLWLESVVGFCVGCRIHAELRKRGWAEEDEEIELCAGDVCEIR